jgi:hypothetical protein
VGVSSDKLPDLIDKEHDPVLRSLGVQVLLHPLAEVLDRNGQIILGSIDPFFRCGLALAKRFTKRCRTCRWLDPVVNNPSDTVGYGKCTPMIDMTTAGLPLEATI